MPNKLQLIKDLLKGTIYATYDVVNMDKTYVGGEPIVEPGLDLDSAFEKQWEFIEPKLKSLILVETNKARIEGLKEADKCVDDTIMILTTDLPSLLAQDDVYKIRKQHKAEIHQNIKENIKELREKS